MQSPTLVERSPVERVLVVARLEWKERDFTYNEASWPGHQLQLVERGGVHIGSGGRSYEVGPGTVMWFYDNEDVHGRVFDAPWRFYSVNFLAPNLPPPSFERRFIRLPLQRILPRFEALRGAWTDTRVPPLVRLFTIQARLLDILAEVTTPGQLAVRVGQETAVWWQVEAELRKDLRRAIDVSWMSQLVGRSAATITRSCRQAVGISPLKRVKQMRMSMARGLVWMSKLTFTEIAERVGYARVHEFSRDYHKYFGATPTEDRERFPRIYKREFALPYTSEGMA
jgi:AraC-like DNA-binding protein